MNRSRRANAGAKMASLIQEQLAVSETLFNEDEDDIDFKTAGDDVDVYLSDFASTDEEEPEVDEDGMVNDGDSAEARKAAKREKIINAQSGRSKAPAQPSRRSAMIEGGSGIIGPSTVVVTAGQGLSTVRSDRKRAREKAESSPFAHPTRQSRRTSSIYNKMRLDMKLESSRRRSEKLVHRKPYSRGAKLTQEQLLKEAIEITEPANLSCLAELQARDEERRRASKVSRPRLPPGPFIRFHSLALPDEGEFAPAKPQSSSGSPPPIWTNPILEAVDKARAENLNSSRSSPKEEVTSFETTDAPASSALESGSSEIPPEAMVDDAEAPTGDQNRRREGPKNFCCRNFVYFGDFTVEPFDQFHPTKSVFISKPLVLTVIDNRTNIICPITGLPARYRDPNTGVPYANKEAFAIIKLTWNHRFAWSPLLNTFVHPFDSTAPKRIPNGWLQFSLGNGS